MTVIVSSTWQTMIREFLLLILVSILFTGCLTAEKPPETATLQLSSTPAGAAVFLDNESQGTTPVMILNIVPGNHTLEYSMTGYRNWTETITVLAGTSHYFTTLTEEPAVPQPTKTPTPAKTTAVRLTAKAGSDPMIVGNSNKFTGTATGSGSVSLTLFGPGAYTNGIVLDQVKPNSAGLWSYTWNPGTKIQSGSYTLVVNAADAAPVDVRFTVIGNGAVSVTLNSYSLGKGDTISFSGSCTTGAPSVKLTLFGPGKYTNGVVIATLSVTSEKTWSFRYPVDKTMLTGTYTISVSDVPKTATGSTQFTIGFV